MTQSIGDPSDIKEIRKRSVWVISLSGIWAQLWSALRNEVQLLFACTADIRRLYFTDNKTGPYNILLEMSSIPLLIKLIGYESREHLVRRLGQTFTGVAVLWQDLVVWSAAVGLSAGIL